MNMHFLSAMPIILFFSVGMSLKKLHFFHPRTIEDIKKFVLHISVPALLFRAFLTISIEIEYLLLIPVIFLMAAVMVPVGTLVAKILKIKSPYFPLLMTGFEMSMFGYALFISLYGIDNLGTLVFLTIGQTIYTFTFLMSSLTTIRDGRQSRTKSLKRFVTSPIILAIALGLFIGSIVPSIEQYVIFPILNEIFMLVGPTLSVPIITMLIGYDIVLKREGLAISLITIGTRKLFLTIFALLINHYIIDGLLGMDAIYRHAMMVMVLAPSTFLHSMVIPSHDRKNYEYVNRTLSLDCIISIFVIVFVSMVYV
jgi:hypothetical protein